MTEPLPKAAVERTHVVEITGHQARCIDCDWTSQDYDRGDYNPDYRRYLAENAKGEHQRAVAGWPGTS